jgi:MFS family permease
MAMGMVGVAAAAVNPVVLSIWRVFTGLGIGGMLSATNAVVSEFSNNRRRKFCISMMVIGYPLGAGIGGLYASNLIGPYGWRAVFYFGAAITSLLLPAIILFVPESVHWLARKQPANALERINASLKKIGHETIAALPALPTNEAKKSIGDIFSPALRMTTILVTLGYFLHIMTFYFLLKWTPRIITAMSFPAPEAGTVLAYANLGGAAGGFLFGVLTRYVGLKPLTIVILVMNAVAVAIFGRSPVELGTLTMLAVIVGFFGNAAVSGLYSIVAYGFPSHVRATGTGFVIGVGRGGAALSPTIAGILLGNEVLQNLPSVAIIMGMGSLIAAVVLAFLNMQGMDEPVGAVEKRPNLGAAGAQARA